MVVNIEKVLTLQKHLAKDNLGHDREMKLFDCTFDRISLLEELLPKFLIGIEIDLSR